MSLALTIDSAHTKQWLQSLHPNIIGMYSIMLFKKNNQHAHYFKKFNDILIDDPLIVEIQSSFGPITRYTSLQRSICRFII